MRLRARPSLGIALLAIAAAACGAETTPEELFAVPVEHDAATTSDGAVSADRLLEEGMRPAAPLADDDGDDDATWAPSDERSVGATSAPDEDPEAVATPGDDPPSEAAADPDPPASSTAPSPSAARPTQPSDAAVARFIAEQTRAAISSDHRTGDVTGDGVRDVVVAVRDADGEMALIVGTWDGDAIAESGRVRQAGSTGLGALVVADLNDDGRAEVLLPYRDRPRRGVFVATVSPAGALAVPSSCPVADARSQLLDFGGGPETVVLACRSRDARGNEGLVWGDGVFAGAAAASARAGSGDRG